MKSGWAKIEWLGIGALFVVSLLVVLGIAIFFAQAKEHFDENVRRLFIEAIVMEKEKKVKESNLFIAFGASDEEKTGYVTVENEKGKIYLNKSSFIGDYTIAEKNERAAQTYFRLKNPIRPAVLDSFFRIELAKNGLSTSTAVQYKDRVKGVVLYSTYDTPSLKSAYATKEIITGVENEICLQGYVFVPWWEMLGKSKVHILGLLIGWLLVVLFSFASFLLYRKKEKSASALDLVPVYESDSVPAAELIPTVEFDLAPVPDPIPFTPEARILTLAEISPQEHVIIQLTPDLYWDIKSSKLIHNGQDEVPLTLQFSQLMTIFLGKADYYVSRDELLEFLGGKDSGGVKDRLDQAIRRFRKALESVPEIQIENDRGKGYVMTIISSSFLPEADTAIDDNSNEF